VYEGSRCCAGHAVNAEGSLDLDGIRANTCWLAEYGAGKDFIITPVGSMGKFYTAK